MRRSFRSTKSRKPSFVIHPMLVDITQIIGDEEEEWSELKHVFLDRARRFAAIQEWMMEARGTFDV